MVLDDCRSVKKYIQAAPYILNVFLNIFLIVCIRSLFANPVTIDVKLSQLYEKLNQVHASYMPGLYICMCVSVC